MRSLAVIPARGGSKRIPRKNIRLFAGQPLISWPIEVALASGVFDDVIVSTDDHEIAAIAVRSGARVPFIRTSALSDDFTPTVPVVAHAIEEMRALGTSYEAVCCIYPGAVSIGAEDLSRSLQILVAHHEACYVACVVPYPAPIQRALLKEEDGTFRMADEEFVEIRTQDLPARWHDAGQFYWGRSETWLARKPILQSFLGHEMPAWRVQDIDTEDDWKRAELIRAHWVSGPKR